MLRGRDTSHEDHEDHGDHDEDLFYRISKAWKQTLVFIALTWLL